MKRNDQKVGIVILLGLATAIIFGSEAKAGCLDLGGGALYCAEWIPGSEICQLTTTGGIAFPRNSSARCEVDELGESGLTGTLVCTQGTGEVELFAAASANQQEKREKCKDHQFSGGGTGHDHHDDHCLVSEDFNVDGSDITFPLFAQMGPGGLKCNSRGVCKTSLEVDIPQADGDAICENANGFGSKFVSFTVTGQFSATARICDGGTFDEGVCSGGTEHTIEETCGLSENGQAYDCVEFD